MIVSNHVSREALLVINGLCAPLLEYVCPLYVKDRGRAVLLGTGVLLQLSNTLIVVTASHVMNAFDGRDIHTLGHEYLQPLAGERRLFEHRPGSVDVDLALIILQPDISAHLSSRFHFVYPHDVADLQLTDSDAIYVVTGYPASKNKPTPRSRHTLTTNAAYYMSRSVHAVENSPHVGKHERVHFAVSAPPRHATSLVGGSSTMPSPFGISGGGVWSIRLEPTQDPTRGRPITSLVGIGIEYISASNEFICARIQYINPMLAKIEGTKL